MSNEQCRKHFNSVGCNLFLQREPWHSWYPTQLYDFIPLILDFKPLYIGSVFDDLWPNCWMKTYQNSTEASWHHTSGAHQIKSWANCYFLYFFSNIDVQIGQDFHVTVLNMSAILWSLVFADLGPNCWIKNYEKNTENSLYKSSWTYQIKSLANFIFF